jgi:methyl-accepting chemotaxis protein
LIKRRRFIVDRSFQQRVAQDLMVIVLLVPIVLWANFYLLGQFALSQNPNIDELPRDWGLAGLLFRQQWWLIALFIAFSFGLTFVFVLFYTHRIAGPVYRFKRVLEDMAEGKIGGLIKLRKGDCFESLGDSLSRATVTLTNAVGELKAAADVLSKKSNSLNDPELRQQIDTINRVLDQITVVQQLSPTPTAAEQKVA